MIHEQYSTTLCPTVQAAAVVLALAVTVGLAYPGCVLWRLQVSHLYCSAYNCIATTESTLHAYRHRYCV